MADACEFCHGVGRLFDLPGDRETACLDRQGRGAGVLFRTIHGVPPADRVRDLLSLLPQAEPGSVSEEQKTKGAKLLA